MNNDMRDSGLELDITAHAHAAAALSTVGAVTLRREMIERATREVAVQKDREAAAFVVAAAAAASGITRQADFNSFRVRIIIGWAASNSIVVASALWLDPSLQAFGVLVTSAVVVQVNIIACVFTVL